MARNLTGQLIAEISERSWFPLARFFAIVGIMLRLWSVEAAASWLARRATKITTSTETKR